MNKELIELFIDLIYANSESRFKYNAFYAELNQDGLWGVNERPGLFPTSEPGGVVYEADMTRTEAKLVCLLHNGGIAMNWQQAEPYIELLDKVTNA